MRRHCGSRAPKRSRRPDVDSVDVVSRARQSRQWQAEQRGRQWLQATLEVTRSLLGGAGEESLATVARAMQKVTRSDFVLVILPAADDTLMIEVAVGDGTESLPGYAYARAGSVSAEALATGHPELVADARDPAAGRAVRALAQEISVGPLMFVPLVGKNGARGVLAVGRRPSRRPFGTRDVAPALAFANHAALALELADGREYQQRMLALEERDRIAAELHDQVLQRLFATGMSMQAVAGAVSTPHAERIEQLIVATDETIVRIRSVIQGLHGLGCSPFE
jgi:signal transduction histidine kinase